MPCEIRTTAKFEKEAKRLIKKYPSIKAELKKLGEALSQNPKQGDPLGKNFYKVRLAIKSKGKGKSGGARVITNLIFRTDLTQEISRLYLATIYDKSERETINEIELAEMLNNILTSEKG